MNVLTCQEDYVNRTIRFTEGLAKKKKKKKDWALGAVYSGK